jgi:hypothetical protein
VRPNARKDAVVRGLRHRLQRREPNEILIWHRPYAWDADFLDFAYRVFHERDRPQTLSLHMLRIRQPEALGPCQTRS